MGRPTPTVRCDKRTVVVQMGADLAALSRFTGPELTERYLVLFGQPARSRNKDFLRKRLAWRIQELAEGGLSERALARIEELGADALALWRRLARGVAASPTRPSGARLHPDRSGRRSAWPSPWPRTSSVPEDRDSNVHDKFDLGRREARREPHESLDSALFRVVPVVQAK